MQKRITPLDKLHKSFALTVKHLYCIQKKGKSKCDYQPQSSAVK
jgi:hypothetical protein